MMQKLMTCAALLAFTLALSGCDNKLTVQVDGKTKVYEPYGIINELEAKSAKVCSGRRNRL
jgi:hypothetical protein